MRFDDVQLEDFTTFKAGTTLPHIEIEKQLIEIGGSGAKGDEFKKECLLLVGWTYGKLTAYSAHPEVAVDVFTKLKRTLESVDTPCERNTFLKKLALD